MQSHSPFPSPFLIQRVDDAASLHTVQHLRWRVFGLELRLLSRAQVPFERDISPFDYLETTLHLLLWSGSEPVGAVSLLLPARHRAPEQGGYLGLELEQEAELVHPLRNEKLAQVIRLCVLPEHRGTTAALCLYAGLYQLSVRHGISAWIAGVNCHTNEAADAELVYQIAASRGLVTSTLVLPRRPVSPLGTDRVRMYSPAQHRLPLHDGMLGLPLPAPVEAATTQLGARLAGRPWFDRRFGRYKAPMLAQLASIPTVTLARFASVVRWSGPADFGGHKGASHV